jgi:CHAD domain-containing protein
MLLEIYNCRGEEMTEAELTKKEDKVPKNIEIDPEDQDGPPSDGSPDDQEVTSSLDNDRAHINYIRETALFLFDRTKILHDLNETCRQILASAAILHKIPLPQGKKKTYKAARKFLENELQAEYTPEEQKVLATVIVLQQRKIKRKRIGDMDLSPIQQREALTLGAFLRIAVGLDDSNSQTTTIKHIEPNPDGMWLVVEGPNAYSDAAAAQQSASLWTKIGYPKIKVLETEEAKEQFVPFPDELDSPGVEASDNLAEAGRKVMRYQFAKMLRQEEGTRLGDDIEALHDMRVATRRLRSAFEVFRDAFEPKALKPYLKGLRATGRALGSVRDLDVLMEKAQSYIESIPKDKYHDLAPMFEDWNEKREAARVKMFRYLASEGYQTFKYNFNIFLNTPGVGVRKYSSEQPTPLLVGELAPVLIYTYLASVKAYEPYLENPSLERLHSLRIEFKKLRYTVEYFQEILGESAKEVIDDLKKVQDHLGDLNDARIASEILQKYIDSVEPKKGEKPTEDELMILEATKEYLDYRQDEIRMLVKTFDKSWAKFNQPKLKRDLALAVSVL